MGDETNSELTTTSPSELEENKEEQTPLPPKIRKTAEMTVTLHLSLGIEPMVHFSWVVEEKFWNKRFTLMLFRNTTGFSLEKYPRDLNRHGQLIAESTQNDFYEEYPEEGTYYHTFVLHKKGLLGLREKVSVVRFPVTIRSAKVPLGRIKDSMELEKLSQEHELSPYIHKANLAEVKLQQLKAESRLDAANDPKASKKGSGGVDPQLAAELKNIDSFLDAVHAEEMKDKDVRRHPKFLELSQTGQAKVLKRMEQRLDANEREARRETFG